MHRNPLPSTLTSFILILILTFTSPTQSQCPPKPCDPWTSILAHCHTRYPHQPLYNPLKPLTSTQPITCVCLNKTSSPLHRQDGLQAAQTCYECGDPESLGLDLLTIWLEVCRTAGKRGVGDARTCWDSGIRKGCYVTPPTEGEKGGQ